MKKRILAICLVVAMAATAIVGASMAYLTDTDEAVNVMTLGNVQIEQHEQDRAGNDFVQGQTLLPYVTLGATERESVTVNGYTIEMRTKASVGNYMDKIVTVTNTGKTDAYVRTLIAIPAALENNESASKNILHWNAVSDADTDPNNNGWMWDIDDKDNDNNKEWGAPVYATITVDGVAYNVYVATNKNVIEVGESTALSLVGIYLDSKVDFDGINYTYDGTVIEGFDGQVNVLVLSQAVQAAGFSDADTALDTAFGTPAEKAGEWFEAMSIPTAVSTADELAAALADKKDVVLTEDVTVTGAVMTTNGVTEAYGNKVGVAQYGGTLDGNGNTLTETGKSAYVIVTHGGTIQNLDIVGGGRGIVIYAPTEDVIIDNVVIDGPGYAINTAEHGGQNLIVSNSTINGWTSFAGLNSASFTNCEFGENSTKCWAGYGYSAHYDRLIKPYVNTTFTECVFEKDFYIDLSALGADCTVTLQDCTSNGVELTAGNYSSYITISLPSWASSVTDCVIFK